MNESKKAISQRRKNLSPERVRMLIQQGYHDLIPPKEYPHAFPFEYKCSCGRLAIGKTKNGTYVCSTHSFFPTKKETEINYLVDKP